MFNQLSELGGVDKRFGKKDYSDDYDKLYAIESPYLTLPTAAQKAELETATKAREKAMADFTARKAEYHPAFVRWVEEMRAQPSLIEQRIAGELDRRARVLGEAGQPLRWQHARSSLTCISNSRAMSPGPR